MIEELKIPPNNVQLGNVFRHYIEIKQIAKTLFSKKKPKKIRNFKSSRYISCNRLRFWCFVIFAFEQVYDGGLNGFLLY